MELRALACSADVRLIDAPDRVCIRFVVWLFQSGSSTLGHAGTFDFLSLLQPWALQGEREGERENSNSKTNTQG